MKKTLIILCFGIILFTGCNDKVTEVVTYMVNEPVFMSPEEFRESLKITTNPVPISDYRKICFYEGYIYISSIEKGIHIIDNRNPSNPQNIGFIEMSGNTDLIVSNGKLYADTFMDLVWFDISNPATPKLAGRLEDVFLKSHLPLPKPNNDYPIATDLCLDLYANTKGIIIGWEEIERTKTFTNEKRRNRKFFDIRKDYYDGILQSTVSILEINPSVLRFALYKNYLYTIINDQMSIIDFSANEPRQVVKNKNINPASNIKTIFSYKDNMFVGTPARMHIYSLANPLNPEPIQMDLAWNVFSCNPIVIENDIAYTTIHAGNLCGQSTNELVIYDISNIKSPRQTGAYTMTKPQGLGISKGILFICDEGLKIFNASNPQTLLAHYPNIAGHDVILSNNVLMIIAKDGLYQYDYSNLNNIRQLSKLPIGK